MYTAYVCGCFVSYSNVICDLYSVAYKKLKVCRTTLFERYHWKNYRNKWKSGNICHFTLVLLWVYIHTYLGITLDTDLPACTIFI